MKCNNVKEQRTEQYLIFMFGDCKSLVAQFHFSNTRFQTIKVTTSRQISTRQKTLLSRSLVPGSGLGLTPELPVPVTDVFTRTNFTYGLGCRLMKEQRITVEWSQLLLGTGEHWTRELKIDESYSRQRGLRLMITIFDCHGAAAILSLFFKHFWNKALRQPAWSTVGKWNQAIWQIRWLTTQTTVCMGLGATN